MNALHADRRLALGSACVAWMALGVLAAACGGSNIIVRGYPHPELAPAEPVGFPPPPAQIETLASGPPAKGCLWADGQWLWAGQRWDWRPGGWILPPDDCRYSPPEARWVAAGDTSSLYYRAGRWYSVTEPRICADPVSCPTSLANAPPEAP